MKIFDITPTIKFVLKAHGEQLYGHMPYIVHLVLVARHFTDFKLQTIALLHDILEDTDVTSAELFYNFGADTGNIVEILTRKEDEKYFDYIRRVREDPMATEIKIADLEENIFMTTYYKFDNKNLSSRYKKALKILRGEIE